MNCTKCGSPVEGKFCVVCGNRVDAAPVPPVAPVAPSFNQPVAPVAPAPMQPAAPAPMQPVPMQQMQPMQPMQPMGYAPVVPVAMGPDQGKGLGVASLILGLLSLIVIWFTGAWGGFYVIDGIMAIVGIILGAIGIAKSKPRANGMAIAGLILSIIGLILFIIVLIVACSMAMEYTRYASRYWY